MRIAAALLLAAAIPAGAVAAETVQGVSALAGAPGSVTGSLTVTPGASDGTTILDVSMRRAEGDAPIRDYAVEMTKRLHLIAVSADGSTFLHEHGERPAADGHFRIPVRFPFGGAWRVFADATPQGLGQQVLRFDISLPGTARAPAAAPEPGALKNQVGSYGVRWKSLDLRAGQPATLDLTLLRDGKPANNVTPFLGVPAHVVLIDAADGTYVHAHAMAAGGMAGMPGMGAGSMHATLPPNHPVDPALALHLTVPKAGTYLLWVQFRAGGVVRTVPFAVKVT